MTFRKVILGAVCSFTLLFVTTSAKADPIECLIFDITNSYLTPMPITDSPVEQSAIVSTMQQLLQAIESINEWKEYVDKLKKLRSDALALVGSLKQAIEEVKVTAIESTTKGIETSVGVFKGDVPGVDTTAVDFENAASVEDAISKAVVVADPIGSAENIALNERRRAFIQQAFIDLHSDVLVAKANLAELKESDSDAQESTSSQDTNGNDSVVIRMKNFENQVQVLEQKIAALRMTFEGIKNLKTAKTLKEEVKVGGK